MFPILARVLDAVLVVVSEPFSLLFLLALILWLTLLSPHCLLLVSMTISVLQCRDMCLTYVVFFFLNVNIITVKAVTQEIFGSFHSGYLNPISG